MLLTNTCHDPSSLYLTNLTNTDCGRSNRFCSTDHRYVKSLDILVSACFLASSVATVDLWPVSCLVMMYFPYEKDPDDKIEFHEILFNLLVIILRRLIIIAGSSKSIYIATLSTYGYFSSPLAWRSSFLTLHVVPFMLLLWLPNVWLLDGTIVDGVTYLNFARVLIALGTPIFIDLCTQYLHVAKEENPHVTFQLELGYIPPLLTGWSEAMARSVATRLAQARAETGELKLQTELFEEREEEEQEQDVMVEEEHVEPEVEELVSNIHIHHTV